MTDAVADANDTLLPFLSEPRGQIAPGGLAAPTSPPAARKRKSVGGARKPVASSQPAAHPDPVQLDAFAPVEHRPPVTTGDAADVAYCKAVVVLVDPFAIEPEPFNGRGLAVFDPDRNRDLIDDMRVRGNTVPVRLRPRADSTGFTCPSGSRRVNAARIIAADQPGFRIAAIIDADMTDAEAFALCLADNHGRSEVTALQRGREIKWAIEHLHGGNRQAYIAHYGADKSVVSRALDLVNLPEAILVCAIDPEELPTLFAEKLAPRLREKSEFKVILARARSLVGERLTSPRLLDFLLTGQRGAALLDRRVVHFGSGRDRVRASATVAPDRSATFKLPAPGRLTDTQKRELLAFFEEQFVDLLGVPCAPQKEQN